MFPTTSVTLRQTCLAFSFLAFISTCSTAQTLRYFEFRLACGHGNWQDTSLIAATSDQEVIDSVLAQLAKPFAQRDKFISGNIAAGNAGYNHNAGHWFKWHFIEDEWDLRQLAVEVCDGCPYTDVDADTAYWLHTLGFFCPWSGFPAREVDAPSGVDEPASAAPVIYPNPARDAFTLHGVEGSLNLTLHDLCGRTVKNYGMVRANAMLDISGLAPGTYLIRAAGGRQNTCSKLIVAE